MTRNEKIEFIREKINGNILHIGTKITWLVGEGVDDIILEQKSTTLYRTDVGYLDILDNVGNYTINNSVMIGDLLDYINEKDIDYSNIDGIIIDDFGAVSYTSKPYILGEWELKRKSIEFQSDECIDCVYNIIK